MREALHHVKSKQNSDHVNRDMPGRKRVRRDIEYIDQLLAENETMIGANSSSAILDVMTDDVLSIANTSRLFINIFEIR